MTCGSTERYLYCSPLGELVLGLDGGVVVYCRFASGVVGLGALPQGKLRDALDAYFEGCDSLGAVTIAPAGSEFAMQVWDATRNIGYGSVACYADIASAIGRPGSCRAVAAALRANPVQLFVPCHRVVCSGGKLGGYRAGIDIKRWLLAREMNDIPMSRFSVPSVSTIGLGS